MARYDKYDPVSGGFRAPLAADYSSGNLEKVWGVGLDSSGRVVHGAGTTGVLGILVLTKVRKAGEIVDVMTHGEVVEFATGEGDAAAAGKVIYAAEDDGKVSSNTSAPAAGDNACRVGHTVEATRLVVRVEHVQGADA